MLTPGFHVLAGGMVAADACLCNGPLCTARVYDRAIAGTVTFTGTRLKGSKKAKDSLVMIWDDDDEYQAGRVQAFLSHAAPGSDSTDINDKTSIAYIHWYKRVPGDQSQMDTDLQCPVFSRVVYDDEPLGNFLLIGYYPASWHAFPTASTTGRRSLWSVGLPPSWMQCPSQSYTEYALLFEHQPCQLELKHEWQGSIPECHMLPL